MKDCPLCNAIVYTEYKVISEEHHGGLEHALNDMQDGWKLLSIVPQKCWDQCGRPSTMLVATLLRTKRVDYDVCS